QARGRHHHGLHGPRHFARHLRPARHHGGGHVPARAPRGARQRRGRGDTGRAMTSPDDSIGSAPPRPWVRWLTLAGFSLFTLALAALIHVHSVVLGIAATLPPTPDPAAVPVSVAVVDREHRLLRPFTTADGRWRLPVTHAEV